MEAIRNFIKLRREVKQRGTIFSLFVVLLLFGLFLEAYMHNFNLVYITLFFVFATAFSVSPFGIKNIGQLKARYDHSERLYAGSRGRLFFRVSNPSKSTSWAIELECSGSKVEIGRIDAGRSRVVAVEVMPPKRGIFRIDKCRLQSLFPLSTVRFVLPIGDSEAIVYPQPKGVSVDSIKSKQSSHFGEEGDFDGLAPYSGRESLSRIHWASVAKGEPNIKKFSHDIEQRELVFDFYDSASDDEARLSQLTLWVLECEKKRDKFKIIMPNRIISSKKESVDVILKYLSLY